MYTLLLLLDIRLLDKSSMPSFDSGELACLLGYCARFSLQNIIFSCVSCAKSIATLHVLQNGELKKALFYRLL